MDNHIQVISRAVIIDDGHLLLTHNVAGNYYTYLPGGHVELGETSAQAVLRELAEELGVTNAHVTRFLGMHECTWHAGSTFNHEINFIYTVDAPKLSRHTLPPSPEAHIAFIWVPLDQLANAALVPLSMRTELTMLLKLPTQQPPLIEFEK